MQGRQGVEQRDQGVRCRAAERAAVPGLGQRPDLDDDLGVAPQSGGEGRDTGADVARVADEDRVGGEQVGPLPRVGVQCAPALLLPLDQHLDADRRPALERTQGTDVGDHAGLVVGDPAPVDGAVALGRLERRGFPQPLVACRLDVVVAVQENGRRAGGPRDLAGEDRRGVG
jgi:hypothetical protein